MKLDTASHIRPDESSIQTIRWAAIVLFVMAVPLSTTGGPGVFTLAICATLFNCLAYSKRLTPTTFNSFVADYIFVTGVVMLTGGLSSPFFAFFYLLIIRSVATYGIPGFAFALGAQFPITLIMSIYHTDPPTQEPWLALAINLTLVLIFGFAAEQAVRRQSDEHLLGNNFSRGAASERQRLLALINSLSHAVLALDEAGKVYLYNAAALELLDTNEDISGVSVNKLLPLHDSHGHKLNLLDQLTRSDRAFNRQDVHYKAADGSLMELDLTATPVHGFGYESDRGGGYIVVFRDITKQKSLDEQRDEFISVTSHELRTPLAIAEANLSTALLPGYAKIEPKAKTLVNQAHENLIFLSALIEDLTTLSRAERDDLKLHPELLDVDQFMTDLVRDYQPQAQAKKLTLTADQAPHNATILTSPAELREVLQNFITNAIKYTQAGGVTLKVSSTPAGTTFTVTDTGIGISQSDKRKVFEKFYRSEDYRTRQTGGTGLGLYITQKLVEKLGASITFTSKLNHGSSFGVLIPPAADEAATHAIFEAADKVLK